MNKQRLYIDVHVLQTVPPSCVNRDDTGSPKTAIYGGAVRARVSSQSWKRAMRLYFRDLFTDENIGLRTKKVIGLIADEVKSLSSASDKEAENKAKDALGKAGLSFKENDDASALFFISQPQIRAIANLAVQGEADKKQYTAAIKQNPGFDMILFGRMVAADPSLNYDAAAQVAHSISTTPFRMNTITSQQWTTAVLRTITVPVTSVLWNSIPQPCIDMRPSMSVRYSNGSAVRRLPSSADLRKPSSAPCPRAMSLT